MGAISQGYKIEINRRLLALAGRYAVASEICRRGFHAQTIRGEREHVHIMAKNRKNGKTVLVEVRTKQKGEWPDVKGIKGPDRVQVFVDYEGKMENERPDFYIVDENFWREYVKRVKAERGDRVDIREEGGVIVFEWVGQNYYGISLRPVNIYEYKERWDILIDKLR